jgi:hypothetical protein
LPVAQKNVIILHFLSLSLWNCYNKFVNDWCVFGEVWVNILTCVLSSKLYLCRYCRETNVLTIAGSSYPPHSAFHLRFFGRLSWRIYFGWKSANLPNCAASHLRRHKFSVVYFGDLDRLISW